MPEAWEDYCGPMAFAAITGTDNREARRVLEHWQRVAGWEPKPAVSPMVLAAALISRGYRLERWSVIHGGWRLENSDEFARRIWAAVRKDRERWDQLIAAVANHHQEIRKPKPAYVEEALKAARTVRIRREKVRAPHVYSTREWLECRPLGTWLLHVHGHVLAARAGEIIAGDTPDASQYGATPLNQARRVLAPLTIGETA